jgi:pimeloyl-ACP methyl ester carboxylesterase
MFHKKGLGVSSDVTVVLVHAAWADRSCWNKVISQLWSAGIRAVAAPLPLTTLHDDVDALERTLGRVAGPVVLVGHAYSGGVVGSTAAANVNALVYVSALAPDEGETVADVFYRATPHPSAPALEPDAHGLIWLPDEAFPAAFAQKGSAEEQRLMRAVQRPISPNCITVPVGRPLWRDRPSWFLIADEDRMIPAETQRFTAERMGATVTSHPVDHMVMITEPDVVTRLLSEVVDSVEQTLPTD